MGNFGGDNRSGGGGRNFGRRDFGGRGRSFGGSFGRGSGRREMFKAVCSNCGKECQIPFRPTSGKPVYCNDCFEKINAGRPDSSRPGRSEFKAPTPSFNQNKAQFDAINIKLEAINVNIEKILGMLNSQVIKNPEIVLDPKAKEPKKVKKPVKKLAPAVVKE